MNMQLKAALQALAQDQGANVPSLKDARKCPGTVCQVDEKTYSYYLEVLPPEFMLGDYFGFAEGFEPYTLFWRENGQHFARQLTWEETKRLAKAAGVPTPGRW